MKRTAIYRDRRDGQVHVGTIIAADLNGACAVAGWWLHEFAVPAGVTSAHDAMVALLRYWYGPAASPGSR